MLGEPVTKKKDTETRPFKDWGHCVGEREIGGWGENKAVTRGNGEGKKGDKRSKNRRSEDRKTLRHGETVTGEKRLRMRTVENARGLPKLSCFKDCEGGNQWSTRF